MTPREIAEDIAYSIVNVSDDFDSDDRKEIIDAIEKALIQAKNEGLKEAAELAKKRIEREYGNMLSIEMTANYALEEVRNEILSLIKTVKTEEGK